MLNSNLIYGFVSFLQFGSKFMFTINLNAILFLSDNLYLLNSFTKFSFLGDSFVSRGIIIKGVRKHARMRFGILQYRYTNYFLRLREGKPPKHYYPPEKTGNELMKEYIRKQRERMIEYGL